MTHKVLVIDDSRGCADLYKMRFEIAKWEVNIVYSAEKALEVLKTGYHPDAILLDIMLPKMQGGELLDILKSDPKTKDIKVIVLTALNLCTADETRLSDKADDYYLKIDILPSQLVKRVTELVEKKIEHK